MLPGGRAVAGLMMPCCPGGIAISPRPADCVGELMVPYSSSLKGSELELADGVSSDASAMSQSRDDLPSPGLLLLLKHVLQDFDCFDPICNPLGCSLVQTSAVPASPYR